MFEDANGKCPHVTFHGGGGGGGGGGANVLGGGHMSYTHLANKVKMSKFQRTVTQSKFFEICSKVN